MTAPLNTVELGQVCTKIGVGLAMAVTPFMTEFGVKLIRNQNIRPNKFDASSVVYLDPEFAATQRNKTVRENDVVIVRTGANIGDACVVPKSFDGSQSFTTLLARPNKELLNPHFLAQFVNSDFGRSEVERLMAGGGKGNLNSGELERLRITLLPIKDQGQVVDVLLCWDSAIEVAERLIVAKKAQARAISYQLFKKKPHWMPCRLNDCLREVKIFPGTGDYVVGSVGKSGIKPRSEVYSKQLSDNHERNILVKPEWLCFGLANDSIAFGVNFTNVTYCVSPAYKTFEIQNADPGFIDGYLSVFNARLSQRYLITSARQGKAIDFGGLLSDHCYFPEIQEQRRISDALKIMQYEIATLGEYLQSLKIQKRGLIQKLLTGQWRVKVPETEAA